MAGLIARLFGGRDRPPDPDPLPGQGGYALPPGPYGASGYPGSTSATRHFAGASPRAVKIRADTNVGITPVTQARAEMQGNSPAEFYGGPMLRTTPGLNDTAGANPLSPAQSAGGHSVRDSETAVVRRQPQIGTGTPGAQKVRNQVALRYEAVPGQVRTYRSAPRGDTEKPGIGTEGAAPGDTETTLVSVPSRFVFAGGGNQTYFMLREMPYAGRGDGARGGQLDGRRYYAAGPPAFLNGGQGQYGIGRLRGPNHRPTVFREPAPWSANYYDTTPGTGTPDAPGTAGDAPDMVYVSPQAGRASNSTGRTVR